MIKIKEILKFLDDEKIDYVFRGDDETEIEGFSSLKNYKQNTFTWAKNEKAYQYGFSEKRLVIVQEGLQIAAQNVIVSKESKRAFFSLIEYFAKPDEPILSPMVGPGTIIGDKVKIGKDVMIGANCVIQGDIEIGDYSRIWNNVTIINNVKIGKNCEVQSGCVIGHDGFAWNESLSHEKTMIKHFGGVELQDKVYLGPNCVVDRGEIDNTLIGTGTKMDANCFVAHNVIIGKNVIMITGSKLYGSSELGENTYIASATVRNQCKIGANSFIGMGAVVTADLPENIVAAGIPARIIKKENR